jgi:hypothetical protein
MHRIDADAHINNTFSEGSPTTGMPGTKISASWLNAVQEEIANAIEAAGLALNKASNEQLVAAFAAFVATHNGVPNPHSATSAPTANRLVLRDDSGRAQFADPSAAQDADTKAARDAAISAAIAAAVASLASQSYVAGLAGRIVAAARPSGSGAPALGGESFGFSSIARIGGEAAGGYQLTPSSVPRNPIVLASAATASRIEAQFSGGVVLVRIRDSAGVQIDNAWFNVAIVQGA